VPSDEDVWIKGRQFSTRDLIGVTGYVPQFDLGSMLLARLSISDYHRFHAPVAGRVTAVYFLDGSLHISTAEAMRSHNYAIYNQRTIVMLNSTTYGQVAVVAIGSTCVGTIVTAAGTVVGADVAKGDELGYFQFGGSTVALIFEQGRIQFDEDLLLHSSNRVESLVSLGSRIATAAAP
jgi:phosphatidylserine decarboxylase